MGFPSSMHQEARGAGFDFARSPYELDPHVDRAHGPIGGIAVPARWLVEVAAPA